MKLIQKIADKLPGWKRGFLTYPGEELLVKSILSIMPSYFLTVFIMPKWDLNKIDKYRRGFLWKGHDAESTTGGHYLVNRKTCTRLKKLGELGIKDLDKFRRALRLRWLWHHWDHKDKPWKHLIRITDTTDRQLFFSSIVISIGDGMNTPFWKVRWLNGGPLQKK
jgi:hypothetical protein